MEQTEKRKYERPRTRAIELQHMQMLAQSPGTRAMRSGYGTATEETWE